MSTDNSARGNADFINKLAKMNEDSSKHKGEIAKKLLDRIEELLSNKNKKDSLKYLSEAIADNLKDPQKFNVTESDLKQAGINKIKNIVSNLERKS